jgi:hypothetical protein
MPKRKTVENSAAETPVAVDVTKRTKSSAKPKTAAATHKRATKKTQLDDVMVPVAPASRPSHDEIARLAYSYWESRGYQDGLAESDWLRAEAELTSR